VFSQRKSVAGGVPVVTVRIAHAGRPADLFPDVVEVVHAADLFDERPGDLEAGVGVLALGARLEVEGHVLDEGHVVRDRP